MPGKLDLFVVTLIDGKRATVTPATDYESALAKARASQREHPCQVNVLPMTGPEVCTSLGLSLPERPAPIDAAVLQQITDEQRPRRACGRSQAAE